MRGDVRLRGLSILFQWENLQWAVTMLSKRVPFDVVALQSVYEQSERVSTLFENVGLSLKSYRAILPHTDVVEVLKYEGFFYLSLPAKVGSKEGRHGLLFLRETEGSALFDPNYGLHVAQTSKGEDAFNALLALRKHYKSAEIEETEGEPLVVTRIFPQK